MNDAFDNAADDSAMLRKLMIATGEPEADAVETIMTGGRRWTTDEAQQEFEFVAFSAPFVEVVRKSDRAHGTLEFTHSPRMYFDFRPAGD